MESQTPQAMTELEQRVRMCVQQMREDVTILDDLPDKDWVSIKVPDLVAHLIAFAHQERQAVREEDATLAEGSKPIKPGNVFRAQREQAETIAKTIRGQARKERGA